MWGGEIEIHRQARTFFWMEYWIIAFIKLNSTLINATFERTWKKKPERMRRQFWFFFLKKKKIKQNNTLTRKKKHLWGKKNNIIPVIHLKINKKQQNCLLRPNLMILYNVSSDWLRKSRDRAKKPSSVPPNKYHMQPLRKP